VTRLLVDGVFFQLNNTGIARVWRSVLGHLVASGRYEIYFLDRGNAPDLPGIEYLPFPAMVRSATPADSQLIQDVCDELQIDVFTSTYYTSPLTTPMLLVIYDMIPELFDFDMSDRIWQEKITSICYAQRFLCISENTRNDLLQIYPEIPSSHVAMAHCGVDEAVFRLRSQADISAFRAGHGLDRPYFLFVGSRVQHMGYKNSGLFFNALSRMGAAQFDVFCVGGEPEIERSILDTLPHGVRARRVELTDDELSLAYGGALALVYPSLYEGFGMPVIEAMASGCPVITTRHGSLAEAAGDAALLVGGESVEEMTAALMRMQDAEVRAQLRERGLAHARAFRWEDMAKELARGFETLVEEARAGVYDGFFEEWRRLRRMQANVDYVAVAP
jgi:glycosyltransferase involved in cell wall biosynthesis